MGRYILLFAVSTAAGERERWPYPVRARVQRRIAGAAGHQFSFHARQWYGSRTKTDIAGNPDGV